MVAELVEESNVRRPRSRSALFKWKSRGNVTRIRYRLWSGEFPPGNCSLEGHLSLNHSSKLTYPWFNQIQSSAGILAGYSPGRTVDSGISKQRGRARITRDATSRYTCVIGRCCYFEYIRSKRTEISIRYIVGFV